MIDDQNLSRRHALIECFDGLVQVSDCGSQNGTFVNGRAVTGAIVLRDGDVISLGSGCFLTVHIVDAGRAVTAEGEAQKNEKVPLPDSMTPPIAPRITAAAVAVILVAAGLVIVLSRSESRNSTNTLIDAADHADKSVGGGQDVPSGTVSESVNEDAGKSAVVSDSQIEAAAVQVMRRISSDDKSYKFSTSALDDIRRKVEEYRASPALAAVLQAMAHRGSEIAAQARSQGIEPAIVLYTGLAETDGGRTGRDPITAARSALPDLQWLRITFGTELADKSLIMIAAYKLGTGTKKSHPLLGKLQQVPLAERNIWYMHQRGLLQPEAYDFVLRFLALGVIAQNPSQFGVAAAAPVF